MIKEKTIVNTPSMGDTNTHGLQKFSHLTKQTVFLEMEKVKLVEG